MPNLLSKRRSFLDLLNAAGSEKADNTDNARPKTSSLAPATQCWEEQRPKSEYGYPRSRLSHEVSRDDLPEPKDSQDALSTRSKRFSMLRFRNYSESQLSVRAKEAERKEREDAPPPVPVVPANPSVPAIVKTAPTMHHHDGHAEAHEEVEEQEQQERERKTRPSLFKRSMSKGRSPSKREPRKSTDEKRTERKGSSLRWRKMQGRSTGLEDLQRMAASHVANNHNAPPAYGDDSNSALALPVSPWRMSESTRSDGSNDSSDQIYGSTTTTTHTVSTHTTFFKLPRRNKNRNSLFPLPVKLPPPGQQSQHDGPPTPRASTGAITSNGSSDHSNGASDTALQRRHTEDNPEKQLPPNAALARSALSFAEPGGMSLIRNESQRSRASSNSSPLQPPRRLGMRDRASTTSSFGRSSHDMGTPPALSGSGRNSTSTTGRSSLGGLLNLSRFRQSSEPHSPRHGSPGSRSKSNSFAMSREALVVPDREEGDSPIKYLERLKAAVARSMIAGILSKSPDPFAQAVLRSYAREFAFFGEPIDMSLRKFLLEAELPKETQQVDRVIQAFADRYHECNPGIFVAPDQAYIIAFSLMMLHTDAFNKNNKRKMQKQDYIRNTSGQQVSDDVLACFYDNICYTPFVHYEEEVDINGERVLPFKPKKKEKVKAAVNETAKKPLTGPVDPYNLLIDQKLDLIRPAIRESINMDDPYNYKLSNSELDPQYLQRAFTHTGTLQIISQRSRPTAYEGQLTNNEPPPSLMEMQPGIIDIKITKVGTLWRKSAKKKKTRSPWQEWGAILTGSQLYMFKNTHWAKGLVYQFNSAQEKGRPRTPVTFKPPLQEFKPDALIRTDNAVALVDSTYNRHKHAFTFIGPGGYDEVLLADNEHELNDWLALINYAAAFRSAGVRIRGMVGGAEEDGRSGDVRKLEASQSTRSTASALSMQTSESQVNQKRILSPQLQKQVMAARRQIMVQKVSEASKEIANANQELDNTLRNARHLLLLAPIAPKTREDMIHAAARADASLKWSRRDIWRMKAYKDILAMDVQQDGVSANEIETLAEQRVELPETTSGKKWPLGLSRLASKAGVSKSPPQSPTTAFPSTQKRQSAAGSLEAFTNDVFRTPPESATQHQSTGGEWSLPPLQLDVQSKTPHRSSVSSALLSTSSQGDAHAARSSVSQASTFSSSAVTNSEDGATPRPRAPSSVAVDPEIELLARATMTPDPVTGRGINLDGSGAAQSAATPESASKNRTSVRRSLQKTLRDSHHGPSHKHRKGKGSDGTVRSATGAAALPNNSVSHVSGSRDLSTSTSAGTSGKGRKNSAASGTPSSHHDGTSAAAVEEQGTPGLKREKGRFILHGKQASVVQFGSGVGGPADWPAERMKARREAWRQNSGSTAGDGKGGANGITPTTSGEEKGKSNFAFGWGRADVLGPSPHDFGTGPTIVGEPEGLVGSEKDGEHFFVEPMRNGTASSGSTGAHSWGLGRIVLASDSDSGSDEESDGEGEDDDDLSPTRISKRKKRTTVIGPSPSYQQQQSTSSATEVSPRVHTQAQSSAGADQHDESDDDDEYATPTSDGGYNEDVDDADAVEHGHEQVRWSSVSEGRGRVVEVR